LIECWRQKNLTGQALWSEFADEFETWDKDDWSKVPTRMAKYLRAYLLGNGVFVDTDGGRIAANLERAAKRPSFRPWTTEEINAQMGRNVDFKQRMNNPGFASEIQTIDEPWQPQPVPAPRATPILQPREHSQTPWPPAQQHRDE
jgi:hypothetical protein